ncbi:MAG: hypothetical protein ACXVCI_04725 [Bdellovibrionota bacterium]
MRAAPGGDEPGCAAVPAPLPALNLDIGLLNPHSYFATSKTPPVCRNTFLKLIKRAP